MTGHIYGINNSLNDTYRTSKVECSVACKATGIICGCENLYMRTPKELNALSVPIPRHSTIRMAFDIVLLDPKTPCPVVLMRV